MERKYTQRGYQESGTPKKKKSVHQNIVLVRNRSARARRAWSGRSPARAAPIAARCCRRASIPRPSARDAHSSLHSCKQCVHFDTSAQFECTEPIPERVAKKDARNNCTFYAFRMTIEKDTAPTEPRLPLPRSRNLPVLAPAALAKRSTISSRNNVRTSIAADSETASAPRQAHRRLPPVADSAAAADPAPEPSPRSADSSTATRSPPISPGNGCWR